MIKESDLKIFSYLPNPRVWKALITAEFSGAEIEVVGDKPKNLGKWLWDFNAEELVQAFRDKDLFLNMRYQLNQRAYDNQPVVIVDMDDVWRTINLNVVVLRKTIELNRWFDPFNGNKLVLIQ